GSSSAVSVANLDTDSALEIPVAGNGVYDARTGALKWQPANGMSTIFAAIDADGDGIKDLAQVNAQGAISVFSKAKNRVVTTITPPAGQRILAMAAADFDKNNRDELIASTDSGNVYVWKFENAIASVLYSSNFPNVKLNQLYVGDANNDGTMDVLLNKISASDASVGEMTVWTPAQNALKTLYSDKHFLAINYARYNAKESKMDFVAALSDSANAGFASYGPADTDYALHYFVPAGAVNYFGIRDYDGDGKTDLLLCSGAVYNWNLRKYDYVTGVQAWASPDYTASHLAFSMSADDPYADTNKDGNPEALFFVDYSIHAFDVKNQADLFSVSPSNYSQVTSLKRASLGGNGSFQFVAATALPDNQLYSYDVVNGVPQLMKTKVMNDVMSPIDFSNGEPVMFATADIDADGRDEIFIAHNFFPQTASAVVIYNAGLEPVQKITVAGLNVSALAVDGDQILVATTNFVTSNISAYSIKTGQIVWQSPYLFGKVLPGGLSTYLDPMGQKQLAIATSKAIYFTK
ncbi:MAG TPA: hypothetical protein VFM46_03785, partial [Pseudomonadales bacterium]|nr:hypothetical protein [Pseudomonadales bacterium]